MRLSDYLRENAIKPSDFAKKLGIPRSRISQLCNDDPGWVGKDVALKIRDATGGAVTPNDFLPALVEAPSTDQSEAAE